VHCCPCTPCMNKTCRCKAGGRDTNLEVILVTMRTLGFICMFSTTLRVPVVSRIFLNCFQLLLDLISRLVQAGSNYCSGTLFRAGSQSPFLPITSGRLDRRSNPAAHSKSRSRLWSQGYSCKPHIYLFIPTPFLQVVLPANQQVVRVPPSFLLRN
jgi:hypothetical protein